MRHQANFTVHVPLDEDSAGAQTLCGLTLKWNIEAACLVPVWPSLVRTEVGRAVQYRMTGVRP